MLTTVIKLGGIESEDPTFLKVFAESLKTLGHTRIVLVHGGGRAITELQKEAGIEYRTIDGLRVTSAKTLQIVERVLWKTINAAVVDTLKASGIRAIGLAGHHGVVLARAMKQELGFVGEVTGVNASLIEERLSAGETPVIAPLGVDSNGQAFNINADSAALGIALGIKAQSIRFVTNVPGVLKDGKMIPTLTTEQTESLITDGTINGGMIPKVKAALGARAAGVPQVWITQSVAGGTVFL